MGVAGEGEMTTRSMIIVMGSLLAVFAAGPAAAGDRGTAAPAPGGVPASAASPSPAPAATPAPAAAPATSATPAPRPGPGGVEMTTYYVALLFKGAGSTSGPAPDTEKIHQAHLANIQKMFASGKLVVAGPFQDGGELRGIFIFRVGSLEEARALCATDPAVQAGLLLFDLHPWLAPKELHIGIPEPTAPPK